MVLVFFPFPSPGFSQALSIFLSALRLDIDRTTQTALPSFLINFERISAWQSLPYLYSHKLSLGHKTAIRRPKKSGEHQCRGFLSLWDSGSNPEEHRAIGSMILVQFILAKVYIFV